MRTSTVLASLLFGSFAAAAPVDKRALVYHTEVVYETVVIYTTVYDDNVPAASPTPEGLFYEQPSSSVVVKPTSSAAPVVVKPSSVYTPTPAAQAPTTVPTTTAAAPTTEAAKPTTTEAAKPTTTEVPYVAPTTEAAKPTTTTEAAYVAPTTAAAAATSAAAAAAGSTDTTTTSGEQYSDVDITIYDINAGDYGACGTQLSSTDMVVAIAKPAWGSSTYDVMTGAATNPWCGQKVKIDYEGKSVTATIMDMCPGCSGHDLDLSISAWNALGLTEKTRLKASWSKVS